MVLGSWEWRLIPLTTAVLQMLTICQLSHCQFWRPCWLTKWYICNLLLYVKGNSRQQIPLFSIFEHSLLSWSLFYYFLKSCHCFCVVCNVITNNSYICMQQMYPKHAKTATTMYLIQYDPCVGLGRCRIGPIHFLDQMAWKMLVPLDLMSCVCI